MYFRLEHCTLVTENHIKPELRNCFLMIETRRFVQDKPIFMERSIKRVFVSFSSGLTPEKPEFLVRWETS